MHYLKKILSAKDLLKERINKINARKWAFSKTPFLAQGSYKKQNEFPKLLILLSQSNSKSLAFSFRL
jgi:hypothetical protein